MRMNAVLSNPKHPEYGQFTVPLPIPHNQYDGIMEALNAMDMGDPLARDCQMDEILGEYPILKRLEGKPVNIDELDYLAKRLDSFCYAQEGAQFQSAAVSYDYQAKNQTEVTVDPQFRREELESWLARRGLVPRWEEGVYERLSNEGFRVSDSSPELQSCRIWQLKPGTPIQMRFIGLDAMAQKFGGPTPEQYHVVYDGRIQDNDLEKLWNKFSRTPLGPDGQPLAMVIRLLCWTSEIPLGQMVTTCSISSTSIWTSTKPIPTTWPQRQKRRSIPRSWPRH